MRAELKAMQRQTGITFLFVTHDQEEALSLSDRLAVMNRARIEQFGTPRGRLSAARRRAFVAGFLGAVNWFGDSGRAAGIDARFRSSRAARRPQASVESRSSWATAFI